MTSYHVLTPENDPIDKNVKIKAFLVVLRPNKGVHRVQRSILHNKRPIGRPRRCFDFVETSPRSSAKFCFFFIANLAIFEYRLAVNVLTRPHEKIFFFKKFIFDLYTLYLTSDSCLNLIWGKVKISKNS